MTHAHHRARSIVVAALSVGVATGAVATVAIAVHEIPRRIAIVTLLVHAGRDRAMAFGLALCASLGTGFGGALAWWSAEAARPALPAGLALSAAAMLCVVLAQSARFAGAWRGRVLTREFGLPFLAGLSIIGGSHHLREQVG